ncbi:MAG: alginate lyase family protein [Planctomycetia bacterium]|nr:alginate lyase family protein [Planctomycetia bacterium]
MKCLPGILVALLLMAPVALHGDDAAPTKDVAPASPSARAYPPPPPAVVDITVPTLYLKGTGGSVVNPKSKKERQEQLEPVRDFSDTVSRMSNWYIAERDAKAAQCGLAWLHAWADHGALLGQLKTVRDKESGHGGNAAENSQMRFLADVALAYLKLQSSATPQDREAINIWLGKLAARVQTFDRGVEVKRRNNNYFKSGVALMATGIAIKNPEYIAEGKRTYDFAVAQIEDDGTLPREMSRQVKALVYHNAAACPLVVMAELARSQGQDWYAVRNHRLDRLVSRIVQGVKDPAFFEARSGHKQVSVPPEHLGWLIYWQQQCKQPQAVTALLKSVGGSYDDPQYGGDAAMMVEKRFFDAKR